MSLTIPDLSTSTTFVTSAVDGFGTCVASISTPIASVTTVVTDQTTAATSFITTAAASWPSQVFSVGMLLAGALLLLYGYKMVRPVNFVAGCYLGGTLSLLLLNIFAPTLTSCAAIVATGAASGLLLGFLCALKRASMLTLLGLVAGEILGDVAYKTFLLPLGAPEYAAFFCIGFFAVLLAVLVGQVGDFSVKPVCSFFGAYRSTNSSRRRARGPAHTATASCPTPSSRSWNASASRHTTLIGSPYVMDRRSRWPPYQQHLHPGQVARRRVAGEPDPEVERGDTGSRMCGVSRSSGVLCCAVGGRSESFFL